MALAGRSTVRFSISYARPPREFVSSVHGIIDSSRIPTPGPNRGSAFKNRISWTSHGLRSGGAGLGRLVSHEANDGSWPAT